ncbi:hypothetical protein [Actinokineospora sp. NBRC 105648]|uniref:hypothetical protein n=1 Tax=Actinokineospora sp. NBRC 105648 TaxID=3032206 RepID=UPI0024A2B013|nr:hypothetical protein [Actinokineospora sp. NBRC 105648]GLZ37714.1 hypothetical protein Acsp05_13390 [Actinokineospora sp. NBRC 105648]
MNQPVPAASDQMFNLTTQVADRIREHIAAHPTLATPTYVSIHSTERRAWAALVLPGTTGAEVCANVLAWVSTLREPYARVTASGAHGCPQADVMTYLDHETIVCIIGDVWRPSSGQTIKRNLNGTQAMKWIRLQAAS